MTENIQSFLNNVVGRITKRFAPEKIILFGSFAGGAITPDSEIDLLIVMRVQGSLRKKANEIDLALSGRTIPMDLIVITPEQYEGQKKLPGTIMRQADREGKVLYERAA